MNTKKLIMAVVTATTVLVGSLGVALWPSPAEALGAVRKFSGPLVTASNWSALAVSVHNPHPTATYKSTVVVRSNEGVVTFNEERSVGPHKVALFGSVFCSWVCTVEVTMTNAILQPSARIGDFLGTPSQHLSSGDFNR